MSLRVSSTQNVYNYQKQLNAADERQSKLMEQGDGQKLHRPSDNSVDYTKYLRYHISDSENGQYQSNVGTGISWMKTTDSAMVSMTDIMTTFKEKTVAAANDTNTTNDMQATAKEMLAEIQELVSLGNTQQGDRYVFAGQSDRTQPFAISTTEIDRGLAKTLDDNQAAYFSGKRGADSSGSLHQMLTLNGSDGNVYYLNTTNGYIYTQDFVENGYKDKTAANADAKVDPAIDAVGQFAGWNDGTHTVSEYFKNSGELISSATELTGAEAVNMTQDDITTLSFTFATVKQQVVTYTGDLNYISMVKQNGPTDPSADTVNVTGQDLFGSDIFDDANSGNKCSGAAMLNEMLTVYAKTNAGDHLWLTTDGQTVSDQAHAVTVTAETKLGARQGLYDSVKEMLGNQSTTITQDITDVSSADVAKLAVQLMEAQAVYNMSLSLGARILPTSLADYL